MLAKKLDILFFSDNDPCYIVIYNFNKWNWTYWMSWFFHLARWNDPWRITKPSSRRQPMFLWFGSENAMSPSVRPLRSVLSFNKFLMIFLLCYLLFIFFSHYFFESSFFCFINFIKKKFKFFFFLFFFVLDEFSRN